MFPRDAVDEFIRTLPELLEALETLVNVAIDGDISDAIAIYKEFQIFSLPNPLSNKRKHRTQESISIKLTPALYENENENANPSKLPIPPSPSQTHSKSRSRSAKHNKVFSSNYLRSNAIDIFRNEMNSQY